MYVINTIFLILSLISFELNKVIPVVIVFIVSSMSIMNIERRLKLLGPIVIPSLNKKKLLKYIFCALIIYTVDYCMNESFPLSEPLVLIMATGFMILNLRKKNDL